MPINACGYVRKMRGGAQSHLVRAEDGHFYVVKFQNNPQHRRILINEWLAAEFLRYLQILTPETAVIYLSAGFLATHPDVAVQLGARSVRVEPGWHFGSRYPGDPDRVAVYDFLPDALLGQVVNLVEFLGMLVFDKWTANANGRQSVFFRTRFTNWSPRDGAPPLREGFVASMIDHGFAFNGPYWDFPDAPLHGLYHRPLVYEQVTGWDDFQPWLDQVVHFPEEVVDQAYKQVPLQWLDGEDQALEGLLEKLLDRRQRVPDLIEGCRRARPALFPNWR
jgi:hypothetical protein